MEDLEKLIKTEKEFAQQLYKDNPDAFDNIYLKMYSNSFQYFIEHREKLAADDYDELIYKSLRKTNAEYNVLFNFDLK